MVKPSELKQGEHMRVVALGLCLFLAWASDLNAQTPYYQSKQIKVVVGFTAGGFYDRWARLLSRHMPKHIPGSPEMIVQNMPGAGSVIAANLVYSVAKPDGLTIGFPSNAIYLDQLIGRSEVKYDVRKFAWIGSPVATGNYIPKLLNEILGTKFHVVSGYQGGTDVDLAVERGELQCRAFTIVTYFGREPFFTWEKKGFARNLIQTDRKRDPRLPNVPTIYELMDEYKASESDRRLAAVVLANGVVQGGPENHPRPAARARSD